MSDQVVLRELVEVQQEPPAAAADSTGHVPAAPWTKYCERRAEVKATGVREIESSDSLQMTTQRLYRVRMRYDALTIKITGRMRLCWQGKTLNVDGGAFDPDGTRWVVQMIAVEPTEPRKAT